MDIVEKMNESYCDDKGRPFQDIRINHTVILHDPFEDPGVRGLAQTNHGEIRCRND